MEIIPAMDLKNGQCVRLKQGEFDDVTVYSISPLETARMFESHGAGRLHLIDLDGAQTGASAQSEVINEIVSGCAIPVQLGGGIRSILAIERWLELGIDRVIVGSLAVTEPAMLQEALRRFSANRIVLAVDARDGLVAIDGWQTATQLSAAELAMLFADHGLDHVLYTDIARDGMFSGPNLAATKRLAQETGMRVIASGGVSSLQDLERLAEIEEFGVESVVVGKAFYEGRIKPEDVFRAG